MFNLFKLNKVNELNYFLSNGCFRVDSTNQSEFFSLTCPTIVFIPVLKPPPEIEVRFALLRTVYDRTFAMTFVNNNNGLIVRLGISEKIYCIYTCRILYHVHPSLN